MEVCKPVTPMLIYPDHEVIVRSDAPTTTEAGKLNLYDYEAGATFLQWLSLMTFANPLDANTSYIVVTDGALGQSGGVQPDVGSVQCVCSFTPQASAVLTQYVDISPIVAPYNIVGLTWNSLNTHLPTYGASSTSPQVARATASFSALGTSCDQAIYGHAGNFEIRPTQRMYGLQLSIRVPLLETIGGSFYSSGDIASIEAWVRQVISGANVLVPRYLVRL